MKPHEKAEARRLRAQGVSVREIALTLGVSKGTASIWVRDIPLSDAHKAALIERRARNRGVLLGALKNREAATLRHEQFLAAGRRKAATDERFRLICALYWGEGSKARKNEFSISNSDPALLRTVLNWLFVTEFRERVSFRVQYHPGNGLTEDEIRVWWNEQLPQLRGNHWRRFVQCKVNRASQQKKVGRLPYGTATIRVGSTELFFNVIGGIRFLAEKGDW